MALSSDLVSEFAKITNDGKDAKKEVTVYGTISVQNGINYVKLDGSDELTPVVSTVSVKDGERVIVTLKQHQAVVTSNLTDPAASSMRVGDMGIAIDEVGVTLGNLSGDIDAMGIKVDANGVSIGEINDELEGIGIKINNMGVTVNGLTTFKNGLEKGTTTINGGSIETGTIKFSSLNSTTQNSINNAMVLADNVADIMGNWSVNASGTTYIDGNMIWSDSIYADSIHLGGALAVYRSTYSNQVGGYLGYDDGFNSDSGIGMRTSAYGPQCVCTNLAARLSYGLSAQVVCSGQNVNLDADNAIFFKNSESIVAVVDYQSIRPSTAGGAYLGTTAAPWISLHAQTGTIQTSDRNKKNSIEDMSDKYLVLFDNLKPRRFKMNNGTSDRYHVGYIAQEVEEAMAIAGVDSKEFAGLIKDKDDEGNDIYMLRYDEFETLYDLKIKQLEARYEAKISDLEERLAKLEARLG